jgi:hypothetical protein
MNDDVREINCRVIGQYRGGSASTTRGYIIQAPMDVVLAKDQDVKFLVPAPSKPSLREMVRVGDVVLRLGKYEALVIFVMDGKVITSDCEDGVGGEFYNDRDFENECTFLRPGPGAVYEDANRCLHFVVPSNMRPKYLIARRRFSAFVVDIDTTHDMFRTRKLASLELYRRAQAGGWTRVDEADWFGNERGD